MTFDQILLMASLDDLTVMWKAHPALRSDIKREIDRRVAVRFQEQLWVIA